MKTAKRIICFILAATFVVLGLASCKKKGILLATYDGGKIYENDVKELSNYLYAYYYGMIEEGTTTADVVAKLAVERAVMDRLYELELKEYKMKVDEAEVKEEGDNIKSVIEAQYEGGWKQYASDVGVSEDFCYVYGRGAVVQEMVENSILFGDAITDEALKEYYRINGLDYLIYPSYEYTGMLIEVKDPADLTEWNSKKAEAQAYLDRILSGEDFDKVMAEVQGKYTEEAGYTVSPILSGQGRNDESTVAKISDLEAELKKIDEKYQNRDASADKSSEEYGNYLKYLGEVMKAKQCSFLRSATQNQVCSEIIESQAGFWIFRFDSHNTVQKFPEYDDIKGTLMIDYIKYLKEDTDAIKNYRNSLIEKYNVVYEDFSITIEK